MAAQSNLQNDSGINTEVLLQVRCADIHEFHLTEEGQANNFAAASITTSAYIRHTVVCNAELLVLLLTFTPDQLSQYSDEHSPVLPGAPTIVIVCGDYKLPVSQNAPIKRYSSTEYVFSLPSLPIGVSIADNTPSESLEAFEFVLRQYGTVEDGVGLPSGSPINKASWAAFAPPPPSYSLEKAQRDALAAHKVQVVYDPPQRLPGSQTTLLRVAPNLPQPALATRVAHGINTLSVNIGEYLGAGTQSVSDGITGAASFFQTHTSANENPVEVPKSAKAAIGGARVVTKSIALVSGTFARGVIRMTSYVASKAVGSALSGAPDTPNDPRIKAAVIVGGAGVGAAAAIFDATMESTRVVLKSSCDGVQTMVSHTLGDEAGETVGDSLGLAQDVYQAQRNIKKVGVKSLSKAAAKASAAATASEVMNR